MYELGRKEIITTEASQQSAKDKEFKEKSQAM